MSIWQQMSSQSGVMCQIDMRSPHTFPLSWQPMRVIVLGMRCQKLSHEFHIVLGRKLYAWRMSHDSSLSARVPEKVRYHMWCRNDDSGCGHATDRWNSLNFHEKFKNIVVVFSSCKFTKNIILKNWSISPHCSEIQKKMTRCRCQDRCESATKDCPPITCPKLLCPDGTCVDNTTICGQYNGCPVNHIEVRCSLT